MRYDFGPYRHICQAIVTLLTTSSHLHVSTKLLLVVSIYHSVPFLHVRSIAPLAYLYFCLHGCENKFLASIPSRGLEAHKLHWTLKSNFGLN